MSLMDFEYHLQIHGGFKIFKCIICSENFSFLSELNDHLPNHLSKDDILEITESPKVPTQNVEVKIEKSKDEQANEDKQDKEANEENYFEDDIPAIETTKKDEETNPSELMEQEQVEKKKRGRPKKGKLPKNSKLPHSLLERKFKCTNCPFAAKTSTNLKLHFRMHTGIKPYECAVCDKAYAVKKSLINHLFMKHNKNKKKTEVCQICGKAFYFVKSLEIHMRQIHPSQRERYPCFVCGKTYASRGTVSTHMKSHIKQSGDYPCSKCNKSFDTRAAMLRHLRNIHIEPRKFLCNYESCNFGTISRAVLREHERTHTGEKPFQCNICNTTFAKKISVERHIAQRHKPATLQCEFCDKVFKITASLRLHIRRVHLERKIPCPVCDKRYASKRDLTRHMKDSHSAKKNKTEKE
ncbi:zinc finger protein 62 homolog [Phlebotomus papatasi]|uniref:zinc finger protein 62 homolog n=1 Tax=Phlebotomus papatasi TaxID=29031 RepID=UPI002483C2CC|nr:zinc finger protein 62 homolog [Phlebotomus papatasi]